MFLDSWDELIIHDVVMLKYLSSGERHACTFGHIKAHLPSLGSLVNSKLVDVILQCDVSGWELNLMVHETVIREQVHGGIDGSGYVVNVK